ncbi:MAG: hypothetical protein C0424_04130 [Sphingobacteriaceae bacterium]|nr:hypothetical protein [Sphingobacteriaceae bacterium]
MRRILALFLFIPNIIIAQTGYVERPEKFNTYLKGSFVKSIELDNEIVESLLSPSIRGSVWIVYSAKSDNPLSLRPGPSLVANGKTLQFMQQLAVKQVEGNWLLVASLVSKSGNKVSRDVELGWIHASDLILSEFALLNEGAIPKKAMIILSLDAIKAGEATQNNTARKFYDAPQLNKSHENGKFAQKFEIYFILKETDGALLLSKTDKLSGSEAIISGNVPGWFRRSNITNWDHRVCFELNYIDPNAVRSYSGKRILGFNSAPDLDQFVASAGSETPKPIFQLPLTSEMPSPYDYRLPVLKNLDENKKEVITIAALENKGVKQSDVAKKIEALKEKRSNINIVFAIDGTGSMKDYYQPVMNSIIRIIQNNKLTNAANTIRFGLIIYRDYADGAREVEIDRLTTDYNQIIKRLSEVDCSSKNKELPEAQYNGLLKGMDKMGLQENHSNVLVLVGDAANRQPDSKGITLSQVVDKLFDYKMSLVGFQVMTGNHPTYAQFSFDMQAYLRKTAEKYPIPPSNVKLEKIEVKNSKKLNMLGKEGKETELFMFGRFTYASNNKPMDVKVLELNVEEAIFEYIQKVEQERALLESVRSSSIVFTQTVIDKLILDGFTQEEIEVLRKEGELAKKGFTAKRQYNQPSNAFKPVVFLSHNERLDMLETLKRLKNAASSGTSTKAKAAFKVAILEQVKKMLGEVSDDNILNKNMDEIWRIMLAVDFTGNTTIKTTKLRDLDQLSDAVFSDFYQSFSRKADFFASASYRERSFKMGGQTFYWIPLSDIPGNE